MPFPYQPEYPLSHVLNLLSAHDRFIREDIQALLDQNGLSGIDAMVSHPRHSFLHIVKTDSVSAIRMQNDFTTLLLPLLAARLRHHIPQLLALPPILAHTIYQTLEFDGVLRSRGYRLRATSTEWAGLTEVILGKREWFEKWVEGERACASLPPPLLALFEQPTDEYIDVQSLMSDTTRPSQTVRRGT